MPHKPPIKPGETIDRYLARVKREHAGNGDGPPGGIEGTPIVVNGQTIGWNIGGEFFTQEEVDALIATGKFPEEPGAGTGTTAFSSTREAAELRFEQERKLAEADFERQEALLAQRHENELARLQISLKHATGLQAQAIQANIDLENVRHGNDLKELALQFENQLKQTFIGEIGAERRTLIQEKGRAQERQVERAGKDPFKFAFNVRGQQAPTTPEDIFKQQQQAFINQPLPQLNFNAPLPQLQAQLGTIQGIQPPTGGLLGLPSLAHGGVVTGPTNVSPSSVINMQRGSDGAFSRVPAIVGDEGPELALLPPGSEIIPLSKLSGVDLTGIPRAQGGIQVGIPEGTQLVAFPNQQGIFWVDESGQLRLVQNTAVLRAIFASTGLTQNDVLGLTGSPADFDVGEPLLTPPSTQLVSFTDGPLGIFSVDPTTNTLRLVQDTNVLRGIFAQSGLTQADVLSLPGAMFEQFSQGQNVTNPAQLTPPPAFSQQALDAILNLRDLPFLQKIRLGAGLPATGNLGQEAFSRLGVLPPGVNQPVTTGAFATRNPLTLLPALTDLGVPEAQAQQISTQFGPFVSPFKAARTLGLGLRNFLPTEQQGIKSLYGLLGFTPEDINAQIQTVTPTGRSFNPRRIGFTGTAF